MRFRFTDPVVAILFFAVAAAGSFIHLQKTGLGGFYQGSFAPAVMLACQGRFTELAPRVSGPGERWFGSSTAVRDDRIGPLYDFLRFKTASFDCSDLPADLHDYEMDLTTLQGGTLLLLVVTGLIWKVTGVAWSQLTLVAAVLAGGSALFLYLLCRRFVGIPLAAAVTVVVMVSPFQASMLPYLRDFSKQPFLLGFLYLSIGVLVAVGARQTLIASALAGLVIGLGLGFRSDLIAAIPFFIFVLGAILVFEKFRNWPRAVAAGLAFAAALAVSAFPLAFFLGRGPGLAHIVLLGLTVPFNAPLGLDTPVYDIGAAYSDVGIANFVYQSAYHSIEAGAARPDIPYTDPNSDYLKVSMLALTEFARNFPADLFIRGVASTVQIANLQFDPPTASFLPHSLDTLRSLFVADRLGFIVVLAACAWLAMRDVRLAVGFGAAFFYFAGICALQFHLRHVFHLEFFYWLSVAILLGGAGVVAAHLVRAASGNGPIFDASGGISRSVAAASVLRGVLLVSVPIVIVVSALALLRSYQQANVRSLVERYLAAPRQPVAWTEERSGEMVRLRPAGPVLDMGGRSVVPDEHANEFYLVATIDSARCAGRMFELKVAYRLEQTFHDITRDANLFLSDLDTGPGYIFFPVGNDPGYWSFAGLEVAADQRACLRRIDAIDQYRSLPLPLFLTLRPDWANGRLYQTLKNSIVPSSIASTAWETRPAGALDTVPEQKLDIKPLTDDDWPRLEPPTTVSNGEIRFNGTPAAPTAYVAVSRAFRLPHGLVVAAVGTVEPGRLTLGLLDATGQWARTLAVPQGRFQAAITVPRDGEYRIVLAHDLPPGETVAHVTVPRIGLIDADPAAHRVNSQDQPLEIASLGPWKAVFPPARMENGVLQLVGEPASSGAYAAVSPRYRLPGGALVAAAGTVRQGGILLGLLDSKEQWAATKAIEQGPFRTAVQVPSDGEYSVVIAHDLPPGRRSNNAEVTEVGLVGLDPLKVQVSGHDPR